MFVSPGRGSLTRVWTSEESVRPLNSGTGIKYISISPTTSDARTFRVLVA